MSAIIGIRCWAQTHIQFTKFFLVGSLNTLLDFVLFFVFANLLNVQPVVASIFSTGITMCMSFFLNHHFVFRSNKQRRHTALQFVLVTAFNVWLVQSVIIAVAIHILQNWTIFSAHVWTLNMLAKLCGVTVSFVLNFLMYRYIFHQKVTEEPPVL